MAKKLNHKTHVNAVGGYDKARDSKSAFNAQKRIRTVESWQKQDKLESRAKTFSLLGVISLILLVATLFSVLRGDQEQITFKGFLEFLQTAPSINLEWLNWSSVELGDWGIFNFFKEIIDFLISLVNVAAFTGTMLVQAVLYILWGLKWLLL